MVYNQLRLRIHEILTYAVQQWGFDSSFDKKYRVDETFGVNAFTKYGSIDLTFYFGDRCFEWIDRVEEAEEI